MRKNSNYTLVTLILGILFVTAHCGDDSYLKLMEKEVKPGKPVAVTYDARSLIIGGERILLFSGSIHYPRVPLKVRLYV